MRIWAAAVAALLSAPSFLTDAFITPPLAFRPHTTRQRRPYESVPLSSGWAGGGWADNLSPRKDDDDNDNDDDDDDDAPKQKQQEAMEGGNDFQQQQQQYQQQSSHTEEEGKNAIPPPQKEEDSGNLLDALDDLLVQAELEMADEPDKEGENVGLQQQQGQEVGGDSTSQQFQTLENENIPQGGAGLLDVLDDALGEFQEPAGGEVMQWGEEEFLDDEVGGDGVMQWGKTERIPEPTHDIEQQQQQEEAVGDGLMEWGEEEQVDLEAEQMRWAGKVDDTRDWQVKDGSEGYVGYDPTTMQQQQQEEAVEEGEENNLSQEVAQEGTTPANNDENEQLVMWDSSWLPEELSGALEGKGISEKVKAMNVKEQLNAPPEDTSQQQEIPVENSPQAVEGMSEGAIEGGEGGLLDVLDDALEEIEGKDTEDAEQQQQIEASDEPLQWEVEENAHPFGSGDVRPNRIQTPRAEGKDIGQEPLSSGDLGQNSVQGALPVGDDTTPQPVGSGDLRPSSIQGPSRAKEEDFEPQPLGSGDLRPRPLAKSVESEDLGLDNNVQESDSVEEEIALQSLGSSDFRPEPGAEDNEPVPPGSEGEKIDITLGHTASDGTIPKDDAPEIDAGLEEDAGSDEDAGSEKDAGSIPLQSGENALRSFLNIEAVVESVPQAEEDTRRWKVMDNPKKKKEGNKLTLEVGAYGKEWLPDELHGVLEGVEIPSEEVVGQSADKDEEEEKVSQTTSSQEPTEKEAIKDLYTLVSSSSFEPPIEDEQPIEDEPPPSSAPPGSAGQTFDLPAPHSFDPLFEAATLATVPRAAVDMAGAHDKFRFEWGTWVDDDAMNTLMERIDEVRLERGAYEKLLKGSKEEAMRYRVAGGKDWDAILHVLPPNSSQPAQRMTGSWVILKCLTGLSEISIRRGPDRDGRYKKLRPRELRGGGDGTLGGGRSTAGADCIKYVGGPERCYDGKAGKTVLLEMILSPPVGERKSNELPGVDDSEGILTLENVGETLSIALIDKPKAEESKVDEPKVEESKVDEQKTEENKDDEPKTEESKDDEPKAEESKDDEPKAEESKELVEVQATASSEGRGIESDSKADKSVLTSEFDSDSSLSATAEPATTDDSSSTKSKQSLNNALGIDFENVGGLDAQLDAIARRVLASRANPEAARRLGVSHVRGVLLSGPPGCGKTLLARELARILGAREPQIVNGPEILDKFIGEAEKKVRDLFAPAEAEYKEVGDDSALHIIILDEMDAIARKRGSMTSDTTGVRDSVVNQLLAKMDGVKEASNVLVVGLTNRPELLDPALLRPGRLEVQLRVELPDRSGRRDILRIHTRQMKEAGAINDDSLALIESLGDGGLAANTEHFTGAELAGLVRSAASFALARAVENKEGENKEMGMVTKADLERALGEVRPALGKQDEVLKQRYPLGISACCSEMERIQRDLQRFTALPVKSSVGRASSHFGSLMLVGSGGNGGAGVTALAAWAAACASVDGCANYVRFITALDILVSGSGSGGDEARASALADKFAEAKEMSHALLVLDDVDQLCAGDGPGGYSTVMLATLRALLRSPPATSSVARAGGESLSTKDSGRTFNVIATTSRSDAACRTLHELFDETIVVPLLSESKEVQTLLEDSLPRDVISDPQSMAELIIKQLGSVGCKTALRLAEQAVSTVDRGNTAGLAGNNLGKAQVAALGEILDDLSGDKVTAQNLCDVFP